VFVRASHTESLRVALDRPDVLAVERIARQHGGLSLDQAKSLLELYAAKGSPKLGPACVRWLARLIDEQPHVQADRVITVGKASSGCSSRVTCT
jgi:hypothetical protein